jgi:hypothetical protein
MKLLKSFLSQLKPVIQLEATMQAQSVQNDVTLEAPAVTEPVNESKADQVARKRFAQFEHVQLLAIIEKEGNEQTADVSIYERSAKRITVTVPVSDYLDRGTQELAARYSNARLEIVHI